MTIKKRLFFFYKEENEELAARKISKQINLPFCGLWRTDLFKEDKFKDHYGFIYSASRSYVLPIEKKRTNPILCKFPSHTKIPRSTNLLKSMKGVSKGATILDATGGFGKDAFEIASQYDSIKIAEKVPWVHYLLKEGIQDLSQESGVFSGLQLELLDSTELLANESFDVIYLDPMFDTKLKKSESKKDIQLLKECLPDQQDNNLLLVALESARNRVIVKRHPKLDYLLGKKPNFSITSKLIRYDIYKT